MRSLHTMLRINALDEALDLYCDLSITRYKKAGKEK